MVRRATILDAEAIFRIESDCIECAWTIEQIKDSLLNPSYTFFVAESGGEIASYGSVRIVLDEAEIGNIATLDSFRRQGLAERILFEIESLCADKNVREIFLEVSSKNEPAIRLYAKSGFEALRIRKGYYADSDAIIMVKKRIKNALKTL